MSSADPNSVTNAVVPVGLVVFFIVLFVRSYYRDLRTIKNGVRGTAVVQRMADTGGTITAGEIGAEAPVYRFDLLVSPSDGARQYLAESKQPVPRFFVPFLVPGVQVPVDIDRRHRDRVRINWKRHGESGGPRPALGGVPAGGIGADSSAGMTFGPGAPQGVCAVVKAVRSGSMPTKFGSAAELLASGLRGTAVIITASPLGKTAGELVPSIDPAHAADPMWSFTVEVELPGRERFQAAFGHRVPRDRLADVVPGFRVAVAVGRDELSRDVAIDW